MIEFPLLADLTQNEVDVFRASGNFDEQWYLNEYPDVAQSGIDPARHYLWLGKRIGRCASRSAFKRFYGVDLHWCIIATPHVLFIAHCLARSLERHGWSVEIVMDPPLDFHHDYYIVLCAQMFEVLPPGEKRIIYQLEQSASSRWFGEKYLRDLENSLAVLDYSLQNIEFLSSRGISYPQVYYMPVGSSETYKNSVEFRKDIEILFYGDYKSSPRRRSMLDSLSGKFNVLRVDSIFGEDIKELICRSKVVINLHYYEGAQLETPRIQECLSLGVPVVSEDTRDMGDYPSLNGAVAFFETGNVSAMAEALSSTLRAVDSKQDSLQSVVESGQRRNNFMLDRALMGLGILPTDSMEAFEAEPIADGDIFALSLPETIERRRMFNSEIRTPDIRIFDGIRRSPGWIGCGMSYKYLCQSAYRSGVNHFTIVEDDVLYSADFERKIKCVNDYLNKKSGEWDIFSGVIAHLHDEVKVINVENFEGIDFVTIDKMTSTVFNIYGSRAINMIAKWNPKDENSQKNTIDRYLEGSNLRVVVAHPYIAGHREELTSTLWGFENTQYRDMINESERKLGELKRAWLNSAPLDAD